MIDPTARELSRFYEVEDSPSCYWGVNEIKDYVETATAEKITDEMTKGMPKIVRDAYLMEIQGLKSEILGAITKWRDAGRSFEFIHEKVKELMAGFPEIRERALLNSAKIKESERCVSDKMKACSRSLQTFTMGSCRTAPEYTPMPCRKVLHMSSKGMEVRDRCPVESKYYHSFEVGELSDFLACGEFAREMRVSSFPFLSESSVSLVLKESALWKKETDPTGTCNFLGFSRCELKLKKISIADVEAVAVYDGTILPTSVHEELTRRGISIVSLQKERKTVRVGTPDREVCAPAVPGIKVWTENFRVTGEGADGRPRYEPKKNGFF